MFGILKSPMIAQVERQTSRFVLSGIKAQKRTLMLPHVSRKQRMLGRKKIFVSRGQRQGLKADRKPSLAMARAVPLSYQEMENSTLVTLGALGEHDACKEILVRHIMDVDRVEYDTAYDTFRKISKKNMEGLWMLNLPYKIGMTVALCAAAGSFPMCFDLATAEWFNEYYVTTDVPEPKDLETWLEVGSWTWNVSVPLVVAVWFC